MNSYSDLLWMAKDGTDDDTLAAGGAQPAEPCSAQASPAAPGRWASAPGRLAAALERSPGDSGLMPPAQAYLCLSDGANHRMTTVGEVDHARNGFDPHALLTDWDTGVVSTLPDGRRLRRFEITAIDQEIEIAPGVFFPAWTYNGRVPGPSLRATEGDRVRIHFANAGSMPHTMHFHGIHSARMDGVPGAGRSCPARTSSTSSRPSRSAAISITAMPCR